VTNTDVRAVRNMGNNHDTQAAAHLRHGRGSVRGPAEASVKIT
jgi:hypothetical protein